MANNITRVRHNVIFVASQTGWPLNYIEQLPFNVFNRVVNELYHLRKEEIYRIEYRIGQVMAMMASDKKHTYKPEQFIGDAPERIKEVTMIKDGKNTVILGDQQEYTLVKLNANIMEAIEDEFDQGWVELFEKPRTKILKVIVHHLLKPNYPEITLEQVGELLTMKAQKDVANLITKMV